MCVLICMYIWYVWFKTFQVIIQKVVSSVLLEYALINEILLLMRLPGKTWILSKILLIKSAVMQDQGSWSYMKIYLSIYQHREIVDRASIEITATSIKTTSSNIMMKQRAFVAWESISYTVLKRKRY